MFPSDMYFLRKSKQELTPEVGREDDSLIRSLPRPFLLQIKLQEGPYIY